MGHEKIHNRSVPDLNITQTKQQAEKKK
jgi:hypothetical protein